jgi:RimJ/RimL family protein N-acetyltransferase
MRPKQQRRRFIPVFDAMQLKEIVANTVPDNANSQRVMMKLGMSRDPVDDFDHPKVPQGHPLRRQVPYRLTRNEWLRSRGAE